ncbi:MAG: LamG-like jellyroll fold domain-containing protein [Planctomycetota bacterium]
MAQPSVGYRLPRNPHPRGAAYLMVMIALALGTILASGFLLAQRTATAVAANFPSHTSARGVAESGLALTLNYLQTSTTWRTDKTPGAWITNQGLSGGNFSVTVTDATNDFNDDTSEPVIVAVTGNVNGVSHTVYAQVTAGSATPERDLLFIVSNPTNPVAIDEKKIDLFEAWGWTVTLADDNDSQADLLAAADAADAVFVASSTSGSTLNTKLLTTTTGIVIEESHLVDDLSLATSGNGSQNTTQLNITDNTHPITTGLSTGTVTFASANQNVREYSGLASGVTSLAQTPSGDDALILVDTGGALTSGTAAARRVFVPPGGWDMDPDITNTVIDTILEQALDWAAGGSGSAATWHTDFDADPTASDPNNDGTNDFAMRSGSFNTAQLSAGVWSAPSGTQALDTDPQCDFDKPTRMIVRMRNTSIGGRGAVAWINFDYNGSNFAPIYASLMLQANGTQTLQLINKSGSSTYATLHEITGLDSGFQDIQLDLDPDSDQVRLTVNGSIQGWYSYSSYAYSGGESAQRFASIVPWGSNAEFDTFTVDYNNPNSVNKNIQTLALYEFNEPTAITPTLVSHWTLDSRTAIADSTEIYTAFGDYGEVSGGSVIDSYNSTLGPYGGANSGGDARVATNATSTNKLQLDDGTITGDILVGPGGTPSSVIQLTNGGSYSGTASNLTNAMDLASVPAPTDMPASSGNQFDNASSRTIGSDGTDTKVTYDNWSFYNNAQVTIRGNVKIDVQSGLTLEDGDIVLAPGATLLLYVANRVRLENDSTINNDSTRAGDLTLLIYGGTSNSDLNMTGNNIIAGAIRVGDDLLMQNGSIIYGTVFSEDDLRVQNGSAIHVDIATDLAGSNWPDEEAVSTGITNNGASLTIGTLGNAAQFDGSDDFIEVPHDPAYMLDQGSLSFWFYANNTSGDQGLVSKDSQNYDDGGHLDVQLDGSRLEVRMQTTSSSVEVSRSSVSSNNWHHVLVSWGPAGLELYFNGTLADSDSWATGLGTSAGGSGNANPWTFGVGQQYSSDDSSSGWNRPFQGRLDDIRLYANQLDATQATNLAVGNDPGDAPDNTIYDTSGYGVSYDLSPQDPANVTWTADGLRIDTGTVLTNTAAATKIRDALIASGQYTFLFRITPESITDPSDRDLFSFEGASSTNWMEIEQEGTGSQTKLRTSAGVFDQDTGSVFSAGEHEILYSFDGTTVSQYVNGTLSNSWPHSGDLSGLPADVRLFLGRDGPDSGTEFFLGTYHRFAIYNKAFDPINANLVYNGSNPNYDAEEVSYQATWIETTAP